MRQPEVILQQLAGIAEERKLVHLQPQIAACRRLLAARNGIDVAVFGRFKAGKSSFLNHLAGRAVLPIGVVPLTAVLTRVRYGPVERAVVKFLDGTTREIPPTDIARYVTEAQNPANRQQVAAVEVELPELQPLSPLTLVDTPGLGSALVHNTETALNWLPQVGVVLLAISADAPLSERDLALLGQLRRHTPRIVVLLTKADLLTEMQRAEVRAFVTEQLGRAGYPDLPVFFYSVRPEMAAMKATLLTEVLQPLQQRHHEAMDQIRRHKLASLRAQLLEHLQVALAAATRTDSARTRLRERLAEERRQLDLLRAEFSLLPRETAARALDEFLERLRPTRLALQARITADLHEQFPQWRMPLPRLLDAWRTWLHTWLHRELTQLSEQQQPMFCAPLGQTRTHLARMLRSFHDRLAAHVQDALGLPLTAPEIPLEFVPPGPPPVDVAYAFDASFTTLGWLIPVQPFRRWIYRALTRKARYEVEKNLSRLAAGWRDRIQQVMLELCGQAEAMARAQLDALEGLLAQTASAAPRLQQQIRELESLAEVDGECPASHAEPRADAERAGHAITPRFS